LGEKIIPILGVAKSGFFRFAALIPAHIHTFRCAQV